MSCIIALKVIVYTLRRFGHKVRDKFNNYCLKKRTDSGKKCCLEKTWISWD